MLLMLNVNFGVILLCALPLLAVTIFLVLRRAIPMYSVIQKKLDRVDSVVQENVSGARVVKAYVCEAYENERFGVANDELCSVNYRVLKLMAIITPVLHIVQNGAVIALLYIGAIDLNAGIGGMSTGTVMAGVTYVTQVIGSIMMATMMFQSISRAMASAKRVREVLHTEPVIKGGTEHGGESDVVIRFRDVSFRYPETKTDVLHAINLDVRRGETVAVIGATGCGKTSLVNLIPRFYDATEGTVEIDGVPIKEYDLSALRHKIGYVLQKSELFSDTVANNIRWGDSEASMDAIKEAARIAQADEFISRLEHGYDSFIAEKGASLSGGQKQRVSIARALTRKPEILILDDATSALDLATEARLRTALHERLKNTTVVLIAQRIASVLHADRIAVIEDGTVVDCAPHEVLLSRCEAYRDIYRSQMKEGSVEGGAVV